ncbi:MAG: hypothetical protein ACON49_06635 [Candidatus Puniceispirillaceae bacterium]
MKYFMSICIIAFLLPANARAEESKGFWASLVPDNSSALGFVDNTKTFFGQLFEDSKATGKAIIDTGADVVEETGNTIKSLTTGDE